MNDKPRFSGLVSNHDEAVFFAGLTQNHNEVVLSAIYPNHNETVLPARVEDGRETVQFGIPLNHYESVVTHPVADGE